MSDPYVRDKVREAIMAARGSRSMAQQLLIDWSIEDPRLLRGMAKPFLKAIAAAALQGEMREMDGVSRQPRRAGGGRSGGAPSGGSMSRDALAQVLSRLGEEEAEGHRPPRARNPASDPNNADGRAPMRQSTMTVQSKADAARGVEGVSHEGAMKAIAKAFTAKRLG